jgi:hypothetical protein
MFLKDLFISKLTGGWMIIERVWLRGISFRRGGRGLGGHDANCINIAIIREVKLGIPVCKPRRTITSFAAHGFAYPRVNLAESRVIDDIH